MRDLKFRAWDGEKMVSTDFIIRDGIAHWKDKGIHFSSENVMQFTGLKDAYGTEIFEGDIIKYIDILIYIHVDAQKLNISKEL